jgi:hypothetical protein
MRPSSSRRDAAAISSVELIGSAAAHANAQSARRPDKDPRQRIPDDEGFCLVS